MPPPQTPEWDKALCGDLYHAFVPELVAARDRCRHACTAFNSAGAAPRRELVRLFRAIVEDPPQPLPAPAPTQAEDDMLFASDPWVHAPVTMDYGINVKLGVGVFVNFNAVFLDTCLITIGARTLVGPNCSFYSGTHPLDPALRNGTEGPETGKEIHIGEDCWLGGNAIILPGVTVGKGCTVGAGSVVTKDIPPFHVVAGNPARILRKIETAMDPEQSVAKVLARKDGGAGAEDPMAKLAQTL